MGSPQLRVIDGTYVNVEISSKARRKRAYKPRYDDEVAQANGSLNMRMFLIH